MSKRKVDEDQAACVSLLLAALVAFVRLRLRMRLRLQLQSERRRKRREYDDKDG